MNTVFMSLAFRNSSGSAFDCFMALGGWYAVSLGCLLLSALALLCMLIPINQNESIRKHQ
jgi:hypothetical protein